MNSAIETLLIANRGEIACRIVRTAREMGIRTVAVYSDADVDAMHVELADAAYRLPGSAAAETYLSIESLVDVARKAGADAVHPGYGFLSENAGFARACAAAGITFVGPTAEVIDAMGSKIRAKQIMARAGVPVLPWIELAPGSEVDHRTVEREIGYPVMVKASAGGGGRGMRTVHDPADLVEAIKLAGAEAAGAFGDATLFVERFVEHPRHIEIQILGDNEGTVVSLFERECSIQRRHQKIIEESPSPVVDPDLERRLSDTAVEAGKVLGYRGAGTVEFVLGQDGRFHFLEMNTRLQVEHPVTEMVTGLDLVRLQLQVAQGEPVPDAAATARRRGHAVEARIYAEDPQADFAPAVGELVHFELCPDGVRIDSGYRSGDTITPHHDAMLAKVIAWAPSRPQAIRTLQAALARSRVHGISTNLDYLRAVLADPEFRSGHLDTSFLTRRAADLRPDPVVLGHRRRVHGAAAVLAARARRRCDAQVQPAVPAGWRNVAAPPSVTTLLDRGDPVEIRYRAARDALELTVAGETLADTSVLSTAPDRVVLEVDGARYDCHVDDRVDRIHVHSGLGNTDFAVADRFPEPRSTVAPGTLAASSPGTVVAVYASAGQQVLAGDVLVVLEAMKMQQSVLAPSDGTVAELRVAVGDQVDSGTVLAVISDG